MYQVLKRVISILVPRRFLYKHELKFRFPVYLFYRGTIYHCNVCDKKLRKFLRTDQGSKICPYCGSLARTRRLWDLLNRSYLKENIKILHFSPSRSLYRVLKQRKDIQYVSSDLSGDFLSDHQYDITGIDSDGDQFDLIICYHILEHVEKDKQAINELYRVLKKGGICIIQTPFKEGDIYEDPGIKTEAERQEHFGQKDHVRIYSIRGLSERLQETGFQVEVKEFQEPENNEYGFKTRESILICRK